MSSTHADIENALVDVGPTLLTATDVAAMSLLAEYGADPNIRPTTPASRRGSTTPSPRLCSPR